MRRLSVFFGLMVLLGFGVSLAQQPLPTTPPDTLADSYIRSPRLGITFISSLDHPTSETRYRNALMLGAGWDRWPLYWDQIQTAPNGWNWDSYDRLVSDDLRYQLGVDAILLGRPDLYKDGDSIQGLTTPIFSDASDVPGADKTINPDNPWANFVYQAVQRYMPGGILAQRQGWAAGVGIKVWEAWNEPDFPQFWNGTIADYARLLKITYIVAHWVSPDAQVMFGGLVFQGDANWLAGVLNIYKGDSAAPQSNWYMDIVAVHNYSYPWRSGWLVKWAKQTLHAFDLTRPIWLNESGVPVWDDYPGPTWAGNNPDQRRLRATSDQQADFFIQSTAYAWSEGADVVFFHQLYDDCGNQPAGTDFPPNNGDLCRTGICAGDAYGLFRNDHDAACFRQHPMPGTARPAAAAFRLMAQVFGAIPFDNPQVQSPNDNQITVISFDREIASERVYVMWNRSFEQGVVDISATGANAQLLTTSKNWLITPNDQGLYQIGLPPATRDDFPNLEPGDVTAIGGAPFILVQHTDGGEVNPAEVQIEPLATSASPGGPVAITPGPLQPAPVPTTDPKYDTTPPTASVEALPETSPTTFTVRWSGQDNSGIDHYLVWVRINGGDWQPWIETTRTEAEYTGAPGNTYEFAVWAVDLAGNWSSNTVLEPQAVTKVQ